MIEDEIGTFRNTTLAVNQTFVRRSQKLPLNVVSIEYFSWYSVTLGYANLKLNVLDIRRLNTEAKLCFAIPASTEYL